MFAQTGASSKELAPYHFQYDGIAICRNMLYNDLSPEAGL